MAIMDLQFWPPVVRLPSKDMEAVNKGCTITKQVAVVTKKQEEDSAASISSTTGSTTDDWIFLVMDQTFKVDPS